MQKGGQESVDSWECWLVGLVERMLLQPTEEIWAAEDAVGARSFAEARVEFFHNCVGHLRLIGEDLCGKCELAEKIGKVYLRSLGAD